MRGLTLVLFYLLVAAAYSWESFDFGFLYITRSFSFHWLPTLQRAGASYALFWLWWYFLHTPWKGLQEHKDPW